MDAESLIKTFGGALAGGLFGYLSGALASARKAGALESDVAHLKETMTAHKSETGESFADVHERISTSKAVLTKGLDDVNNSFIQIMKETAEIKGILIGKGVIK